MVLVVEDLLFNNSVSLQKNKEKIMYVHELKKFLNTVKDGECKVLLYDPKNARKYIHITDGPTLKYEGLTGPDGEIIFTVIHNK